MSTSQDIRARILHDFQRHLRSRGFQSGTDFEPCDRDALRSWHAVPGHVFIAEFMEKFRDYVEHYREVYDVVEFEIAECYKINN